MAAVFAYHRGDTWWGQEWADRGERERPMLKVTGAELAAADQARAAEVAERKAKKAADTAQAEARRAAHLAPLRAAEAREPQEAREAREALGEAWQRRCEPPCPGGHPLRAHHTYRVFCIDGCRPSAVQEIDRAKSALSALRLRLGLTDPEGTYNPAVPLDSD